MQYFSQIGPQNAFPVCFLYIPYLLMYEFSWKYMEIQGNTRKYKEKQRKIHFEVG